MKHHRSTTTHTSVTLTTRDCTTRLIRNPGGFSASTKTTIKQPLGNFNEISRPIKETILDTLINHPKNNNGNNNNDIISTQNPSKFIVQDNTHHLDSNDIKKKINRL